MRQVQELRSLSVYRNIAQNNTLHKVQEILTGGSPGLLFGEITYELISAAEGYGMDGNAWQNYLLLQLATEENPFSLAAEKLGDKLAGTGLLTAAARDIKVIKYFLTLPLQEILPQEFSFLFNYRPAGKPNPASLHFWQEFNTLRRQFTGSAQPEELALDLARFYHAAGCGLTGLFTVFRWEPRQGLVGVEDPDPVTLDDLVGYARQKEAVIKNTEAFLRGKPANNMLLYGDRGTGKSSTIKALVNRYAPRGLRLVEVGKNQLASLPAVLRCLKNRARRFIIFIDDLSFESHETDYKYLKALLEGGVEARPENVVIYATSNRRHLVQERWRDRESPEVHHQDSLQEKLSLSDRFGITVTFTSPGQEEYLQIVEGLARRHGLDMPPGELREAALKWERWHNARSGRTARQFVEYMIGMRAIED